MNGQSLPASAPRFLWQTLWMDGGFAILVLIPAMIAFFGSGSFR